jgi:ketosteroid isomerase-like protein
VAAPTAQRAAADLPPARNSAKADAFVAYYASSGSLIDGSPYRNPYLSLVRVSDGKIVEWIEFCDPEPLKRGAAVLQAAGGGSE